VWFSIGIEMPKVDRTVTCRVRRSFAVEQAAGMFDVELDEKSSTRVRGELPGLDEDWVLGAVVGPSGSGKGTVTREVYGDDFLEVREDRATAFDWDREAAIVDGFGDAPLREVTALLGSVGLATPPAWVRPYAALSTGQRFRADLARALLLDRELVAFDEFGGTVSEQVANVCAATVGKTVRKGRSRCRRFVAVGARDNFVDWLDPDWVLDMSRQPGVLEWRARGRVQPSGRGEGPRGRPGVGFEVRRGSRSAWPVFKPHHYLSGALASGAKVYLARVRPAGSERWELAGFCATLVNAGHAGYRRVHRLVVLPDWQGLGIGGRLLDAVAAVESVRYRLSITTSHPALIASLGRGGCWRLADQTQGWAKHTDQSKGGAGTFGRCVATFRWVA
jgi:GNAT superfamily N-acetyltransferase